MERSLKSFVLAVAVIVCLGLSSTPASAKKTIRITNVPMQVTSAELQRRIQYLEAQVNTLNSRTTALVSNKTQTQVQVISGSPASSVQSGTGSGGTNFSDITGATKPQDNADVTSENISAGIIGQGALASLNAIPLNTSGGGGSGYITSSGGTALKDNDVITSQGTAANIANQGALAVQSTQGLGFSDLRIGTYSGESQSSTISIAFGPGMVLMDSAGATLSLSSGVSGQTISASVIGAGGCDVAPPTSPVGPYYYFLYEIYDPATQTAAAMASQSSSNPAMPSGYTYLRWIGAAVYQSNTEQFYSFVQNNYDYFYLSTMSFASGVGNLAQFVPPIALASVVYVAPFVNWTSGNVGCVLSNDGTLKYTSVSVDYLGMSLVPGGPAWIPLTTSQTIYAIKVGGGVGTAEVQLLGFRLNL